MSASQPENSLVPDLTQGIAVSRIPVDGVLLGRVGEDRLLLARVDGALVAVGASCSHYGGALHEGLRVGATISCPLHHACFDLRTGVALKAPALSPLVRWRVEERGGVAFVEQPLEPVSAPKRDGRNDPATIVIVGGGAAGFAAAQRLRDLGYAGDVTLISADASAPYDRPNVSKDYLAGTAEPAWMPLKDDAFYRDNKITLRTATRVETVDAAARRITLAGGEALAYGVLLLATGAEPNRPATPGFERDNVCVLRSLQDSDRLVEAVARGSTVAIVGSSFIGLEAAASLRTRGLAVHVIGRETAPLESKLGPAIGGLIRSLHEQNGVQFHLGRSVERFDGAQLTLDDGSVVAADVVVLGVGVTPRFDLAESAGLAIDKGVLVDASMRSSDPHIFAAGDIARFPNPLGGEPIRVEHWVLAERLGQIAAHGMLGIGDSLREPPFFWSVHYDVTIRYVGHADRWDRIEHEGSVAEKDAEVRYIKDGAVVAVATINRDLASLEAAQRLADRAKA
jgi:NADPH-dependent 2,4-dienoyl-CoA reductase/sulfur reductase-like enzyme/nitrite reductase/ring-hydroxylating ferredoxin subunit